MSNSTHKEFNTNIDYQYEALKDSGKSNPEITAIFINYLARTKYPRGLAGQWRRLWGGIQDKLDKATEEKPVVDLNSIEFEFVSKLFDDEVATPASETKYFNLLEEKILELK